MHIINKIKKCILNLKSYKPVLYKGKYKLDANENSYEIPNFLKEKILKKIIKLQLNRYPDSSVHVLKKLLSKKLKVKEDMIFVGNGSDEIISYLCQTFLEKNDTVIVPSPTFEMYKIISQINDARIVEVPLDKNFDIDDKKIIKFARILNAKMIFISYPNNPTGNCFSEEKILNIIKNTDSIIVIDEAYFEFSGKTFLKYLKKFNNLIILRTFSKAFSMAALRIGYMIAAKEIVNELNKVRLPYNVNTISQMFAAEMLKYEKIMKKFIKKIIIEREEMYKRISQKFFVVKSDANFLFIKVNNTNKVEKIFKKNKISIRVFKSGLAKDFIRITVGKTNENALVLNTLNKIK
jgi:histidinol-phosphate aminotransferase